jgi:N,N'-diacetyllegionaminate synthase
LDENYGEALVRCRIIAVAGVNHNANLQLAFELIDVAIDAGADFVKFQTAIPEEVVSRSALMARYQIANTGLEETQLEMTKKIHLKLEDFKTLRDYCQNKIGFMTTAFDLVSLQYIKELNLDIYKIPSGEITNLPYLRKIGSFGKEIILSTGMSTLEEVAQAVEVLCAAGAKRNMITILHCTTEYPAPYNDVNLACLKTMRDFFQMEIGYSDHTLGCEIPFAAVALGASIIEKHFTMSRSLPGPDHKASLEPDELKSMVAGIRRIELAAGDGVKRLMPSEAGNLSIARKSIVAKRDIYKGQVFTLENLTTKRPGTGISPMQWDEILGSKATRDYKLDDLIEKQ